LRRRFAELGVRVAHVNGYKAAFHVWLAQRNVNVGVLKTEHGRPELHTASLAANLKARLYAAADAHATRASRALVVYVTQELRQFYVPVYDGLRATVIYNGIERLSRERTQRPTSFAAGDFNVAIVGRLEPVKAVHLAIEALRLAPVPMGVRLHVIGDGPLREQLALATRQQAVEARVIFHGFRSNARDYIAHADALLIPSLHEGLPYTVLEAMALGTPVIAARVGGLQEILESDGTAILFEPGQARTVAAALARAVENPTMLERLAANALLDVHERFSAEVMGDAYCRLYDKLAAGQ
jgi:glycosyltransferase involved in cell wall biosynthesis